jgi:dTDP-4-amino-4,6-dideoxygalactose transaminase
MSRSVWHHFCILAKDRNSVRQNLIATGIHSEIHYPNVAAMEVEKYLKTAIKKYPKSETIANETLSLPLSPWHSNQEIYRVIEKLNSF